MISQFSLKDKSFAPLREIVDSEGNVTYTTNGDDWIAINTQAEIDDISSSLTGGGEVWLENGKVKCSGKARSPFHVFDMTKKEFVFSEDKRKTFLEEMRARIRAEINAKRNECVDGGAYVPEIDKWVDSDEKGRATLVEIKADFDLNDKDNTYTLICADNTAHVINYDEFKAVWNAVKTLKEKMFENAYMHKVLLDNAENPQDYDWSIGWSETYEDYLAKYKSS